MKFFSQKLSYNSWNYTLFLNTVSYYKSLILPTYFPSPSLGSSQVSTPEPMKGLAFQLWTLTNDHLQTSCVKQATILDLAISHVILKFCTTMVVENKQIT